MHEVLSSVKAPGENEILETIAPFNPALLLDKLLSLGYRHWLDRKQEGEYRVYFIK